MRISDLFDAPHALAVHGARFLLMVCVGMFLAYWAFILIVLLAAAVRRRPAVGQGPVRAHGDSTLYTRLGEGLVAVERGSRE